MNLQRKFKEMGIFEMNKKLNGIGYKVFQYSAIEEISTEFNIATFTPLIKAESKLPNFIKSIVNGIGAALCLDVMNSKDVFKGTFEQCQAYLDAYFPVLEKHHKETVGAI